MMHRRVGRRQIRTGKPRNDIGRKQVGVEPTQFHTHQSADVVFDGDGSVAAHEAILKWQLRIWLPRIRHFETKRTIGDMYY